MKKIFEIIKNNSLFEGIAFSDFEQMFGCLSTRTVTYKKNEIILLSGDTINYVGLILTGGVKISKEDVEGQVSILAELGIADLFGETFACAGIDHSPVTIQASEDAEILFIDYKKIITSCSLSCPFHARLIRNMLKLIAHKNLMLNQKMELLSKRTTREKLLLFFDMQRGAAKKFTIPFSREELARYLCVDRSAMSKELSKMRQDGLVDFHKNHFELP